MADTHLDPNVLSALQEIMEDEYPTLVDTFLADSEQRLQLLKQAADATQFLETAHSFKGSSSNMGAVGLASLCHELEERVRQQPLYGIEDLINRIDQEYLEVQRFYRGERARVSAG